MRKKFKLLIYFRTDYQFATPSIAALARNATIFKQIRFSDHAPLIVGMDAIEIARQLSKYLANDGI